DQVTHGGRGEVLLHDKTEVLEVSLGQNELDRVALHVRRSNEVARWVDIFPDAYQNVLDGDLVHRTGKNIAAPWAANALHHGAFTKATEKLLQVVQRNFLTLRNFLKANRSSVGIEGQI